MKSYLLLRNNEEFGPYTLDELKSLPLQLTDLIWTEGKMLAWKQLSEIESVQENKAPPTEGAAENDLSPEAAPAHAEEAAPLLNQASNRNFFVYTNLSLFALTIGILLLGANFIRKVVTGFEPQPGVSKNALAFSNPAHSLPNPKDALDENYRNALTTEFIPASDTAIDDVEQAASKSMGATKTILITTNEFHVDVSGGILDLEVKVSNNSAHKLDRIVVQVDFLNASGKIIQSEIIRANSVLPNETKTIKVPECKKGVSIDYRVKEVRSRSFTTTLQSA